MAEDLFFFQQKHMRAVLKRFRKLPEDLPESLKFAHLNPKAAAFLASKEKQKQEEDLFGDGLGKKSLMPEISQAFMSIKNRLDNSLSNDEDSQRYLFEEARVNAATVLTQLAKIIYSHEDIASHIPKSLEYSLMCGSKELTTDVIIVPREWQTCFMKEAHAKSTAAAVQGGDEGDGGVVGSSTEDGRSRAPSVISMTGDIARGKKRILSRGGPGLPEITEDNVTGVGQSALLAVPHGNNGSRLSISSHAGLRRERRSMQIDKTAATSMTNPSYYMSVIQFQLSSKICEDKGWIVQKGREDELAKEAVLEWCVQILQQARKIILEQKAQEKEMGYDSPVQVRYYGDTRKETLLKYRKSPVKPVVNPATKGGKPLIPIMHDDQNEGRQLVLTGHLDGTTVAYYPSGRPAVVSSAAGFGRVGFYTVAYDDDPDNKMLACFTPSGCGVCYHSSGNVRFLAHRKGGRLAESNGRLERKWKWPPGGVKITLPIGFQLNSHISFRCVSESHMILFFSCQKEIARFPVHAAPGASAPYGSDENEQLLTNFTFISRAARDLLRLFAPKVKTNKSKLKKKDKLSRQLAELVKSVDTQEKSLYDSEADKELARLQRKTRNLIDDWMEHYRLTIGLHSPHLSMMSDSPTRLRQRRQTQSAKPLDGDRTERCEMMGMEIMYSSSKILRAPSAPAVPPKQRGGSAASRVPVAIPQSKVPSPVQSSVIPTVKFESIAEGQPTVEETAARDENLTQTTSSFNIPKFAVDLLRSKSAMQLTRSLVRQETESSLPDHDLLPNMTLCPNAVHQLMLHQPRPQCRCSRHAIPVIRDVEYDRYISKEAPASQLQIIMIHSSLYPNTNPAESMINRIYATQNRNRTRPCLQSRADTFRILKYDINSATEDCTHSQPLLLTRHNVVPGMFLIYAGGKLLFCDHILNGYGYTQKDFKKQVMKSRYDFLHGQSLPSDFRFSPSKGCHGPRSAWGGEIGGTGVDSFGSPGTALVKSLTQVPVSGNSEGSSNPFTEQLSELSVSLRKLLALKALDSSDVPSLPPIMLPPFQKRVHCKSFGHESVRIGLPSMHSFSGTEINPRRPIHGNPASSAKFSDKVAAK